MKRRTFLTYVATTPLLGLSACRKTSSPQKSEAETRSIQDPHRTETKDDEICAVRHREQGPGRVLNETEWKTLDAVCARILPQSDGIAGAQKANVVNYIDAQLLNLPLSQYRVVIQKALAHLDAGARLQFSEKSSGKSFAQLNGGEQDRLIRELQHGRVGRVSGEEVLKLVIMVTLEGFLSEPIYGGNHGECGWKSVGFVARAPRNQCRYIKVKT